MKIKDILIAVSTLTLCGSCFIFNAQAASSRAPEGFSVLVAPANIIVTQIVFDLSDRHPCVLVSYEPDGNATDPFMHVWNNNRWVPLSFENYKSGTFIKRRPNQVVVLGQDNDLTGTLITSSQSWGPQTFNVPVTNAREIINGLGQRFNFSMDEWRWFAAKYELQLQEVNAGERREIWYDQPNYFKQGIDPIRAPQLKPQAAAPSAGTTYSVETPLPSRPEVYQPSSIDVNPAVIKTTPASVDSSRLTTLPSIETTPHSSTTVITSGTVNGQPRIVDEVKTEAR